MGFTYICDMFKDKINRYITEKGLFGLTDKVLVALSGGADSVALLRVLLQLGYRCEAAHCNFHLRGAESDRDEAFVACLCETLRVPLHKADFQTKEYAAERGISIEMAARELRYAWFESLLPVCGARVIAVAHHRDDSVETFLLNLVRGTGIKGLKGIAAVNGRVVRPMLGVSRADILDYLEALQQDYVTDSTNLVDEYMRNKIRLNVLPLLRELNPSVDDTLAETAMRLSDTSAVYQQAMHEAVQRVRKENCISIAGLLAEVAPQALLYELLYPLGFNSAQVGEVFRSLKAESGRRFLSKEWELLKDRDFLLLRPVGGEYPAPELLVQEADKDSVEIEKDNRIAFLDADTVMQPLVLRKWQSGDAFVPFGMKGKKSVRNYLKDRKKTLFEKENQYVVFNVSGEVVWLVNERIDDRFKVTGKTQRVLVLRIKNQI